MSNGQSRLYAGPIMKNQPLVGGRGDIGVHPRWFVQWLYSMNSPLSRAERLWEMGMGVAACAGYDTFHMTEALTGRQYCNDGASAAEPAKSCSGANQSADAFGYPLSLDARPNMLPLAQHQASGADQIYGVGVQSFNNWTHSNSDSTGHFPAQSFIPYLLTGDWYWYWSQNEAASWALANATYSTGYSPSTNSALERQQFRHGAWGILYPTNNIRTTAWAMRRTRV